MEYLIRFFIGGVRFQLLPCWETFFGLRVSPDYLARLPRLPWRHPQSLFRTRERHMPPSKVVP